MSLGLNPTTGVRLEVFGPTVEFLTAPQEAHNDLCLMRGVIPSGAFVPLHGHMDVEDFFVLSGRAQALKQVSGGYAWVDAKAGDLIHIPSGVPHAWRNISPEPFAALFITTSKMGRFFQAVGRPATGAPQPVTPEDLARFLSVSAEYGYWNATPEENAAVGIQLSY